MQSKERADKLKPFNAVIGNTPPDSPNPN